MGIKVVGTGKYPNPNRAAKKGEQKNPNPKKKPKKEREKPKRKRPASKGKSKTPDKSVREGQKKNESKYYFHGGFSGSDVAGGSPSGFSLKSVKEGYQANPKNKDVDKSLNKVLSKMSKEKAKKYRSRPKYSR